MALRGRVAAKLCVELRGHQHPCRLWRCDLHGAVVTAVAPAAARAAAPPVVLAGLGGELREDGAALRGAGARGGLLEALQLLGRRLRAQDVEGLVVRRGGHDQRQLGGRGPEVHVEPSAAERAAVD
eukprot:CAMPEP_0175778634 /NCGR_PEP_ID=MMETSP0097-20121207/75799_1 /TAXON_ID=311494 /ORGANISM="Alexandrium monilatum, Strain CCMP3105" /LENGTH=125 /DNA_ID=CAMNT_0017089291 /DNA_START=309 /DNA_END=689 /DNA_ORIENTATION=-